MPKAKKAAPEKQSEMVTVKELAAKHKIEPRQLRVILRSTGMRAKDGRYEWKENDAFLKKLPELIKELEEQESAKKAAKK